MRIAGGGDGAASVHLPLPAGPLLLGQQFLQQVVTLELGTSAAIVDATSSNALLLTVGRL